MNCGAVPSKRPNSGTAPVFRALVGETSDSPLGMVLAPANAHELQAIATE
jgi:hypothetical protein